MNRVFGIVSCDVIDSTFLDMEELIQLRRDIRSKLFPEISAICPESWGRIVRGDTIECCMERPYLAFRVALLMKCWFMDWADYHDASSNMRRSGVRFSIGIGPMRLIDREEDFMDGEAIYIAGRNLDYISERGIPVAFGMDSRERDISTLITNSLLLVNDIIESSTDKQLPILYDRISGLTENEISRKLSISQGAVNQRAKNAGWPLIRNTLDVLENLDFEKYVL